MSDQISFGRKGPMRLAKSANQGALFCGFLVRHRHLNWMLLTVALRLVRLQVRLQLESLAALGDVTDKIALQTLKKVTVSGEG